MQSIIDIIRILLFLHLLNLLLLLSFRTIFLYEQIRKNIDNLIVIRNTKCCFFLMFFFISRLSSVDSLLNTRHLLIPIVINQAWNDKILSLIHQRRFSSTARQQQNKNNQQNGRSCCFHSYISFCFLFHLRQPLPSISSDKNENALFLFILAIHGVCMELSFWRSVRSSVQ